MTIPVTRDLLRRLPKAELHCHLDGSVRPSTLLELGREYRAPMPRATAEELADYMRVDDARNLEEYLERFDITLRVMQTADALERIAYELAEDAAAEGVRYIEVRYAPVLNVRGGLTLAQAVEAPLRGLRRAQRDHGVIGRVLVCSLRHLPPATSLDLARLAVDFKGDGVVGFDLAGGEAGNPAAAHAAAFLYARENDLACTCHAGEGDGPDSVRQAVHVCGAHRLGHGTHLIDDPSLTQYVNDRRITVEVCLTSNVQTRAADSYEAHPFRRYYDAGLSVVLNTDNRLMSGTTLVDEYAHAAERLDFTAAELCQVARNGFEGAFLPYQERQRLIEQVDAEMAALMNGAAPAAR